MKYSKIGRLECNTVNMRTTLGVTSNEPDITGWALKIYSKEYHSGPL